MSVPLADLTYDIGWAVREFAPASLITLGWAMQRALQREQKKGRYPVTVPPDDTDLVALTAAIHELRIARENAGAHEWPGYDDCQYSGEA